MLINKDPNHDATVNLSSMKNATSIGSATAGTGDNAAYNSVITAGGSQSFGFTGSWSSNNASPQRIEPRDRLIKACRRAGPGRWSARRRH